LSATRRTFVCPRPLTFLVSNMHPLSHPCTHRPRSCVARARTSRSCQRAEQAQPLVSSPGYQRAALRCAAVHLGANFCLTSFHCLLLSSPLLSSCRPISQTGTRRKTISPYVMIQLDTEVRAAHTTTTITLHTPPSTSNCLTSTRWCILLPLLRAVSVPLCHRLNPPTLTRWRPTHRPLERQRLSQSRVTPSSTRRSRPLHDAHGCSSSSYSPRCLPSLPSLPSPYRADEADRLCEHRCIGPSLLSIIHTLAR